MASCLIRSACSRDSEIICWAFADASSTILRACASVSTIFLTASIPDKLRGFSEKSYRSFRRNREWAYKTVGSNSPINTVKIEGCELMLRLDGCGWEACFIKLIRTTVVSLFLPGAKLGRGWLVHRRPIGYGDGLMTLLVATRSYHPLNGRLRWGQLLPPTPITG